jgi:hypothetical protein
LTVAVRETWFDLKPFVLAKYDVNLSVGDFVNSSEYSQLICFHADSFARRWCKFRNLAFFDRHFFFFSPGHFRFPEPFLVPGPRAPPFDRAADQLLIEPIVIPSRFSGIPRRLQIVNEFSYVYGNFHNARMLWHSLFDFTIPLYHFIRLLNGSDTPQTRRLYLPATTTEQFPELMKLFSDFPITNLEDTRPSILMVTGVIGIEKLELNVDENRTYGDSIAFHYDFNRSHVVGLRAKMLETLAIPADEYDKPLVVVIDRNTTLRNLTNRALVLDEMKSHCPHCDVQSVVLHELPFREQVAIVSRASVLVGVHGSGLAQAVWMRESRENATTHLVEIIPYGYTCRDWYETAAHVAGIVYHGVMNRRPPERPESEDLAVCLDSPGLCATLTCHDPLRDQAIELEMDTFLAVWDAVAEALKPN